RHLFRLRQALEQVARATPGARFKVAQLGMIFGSGSAHRAVGYRATRRAYERFLAANGRLMPAPDRGRFAVLRERYRQHLADLRGLTAATIRQHDATVCDLLSAALGPDQPLADLTGAQVERYVLAKSTEITRQSLQHTVARLRAFLRYGYEHGEIRSRLDVLFDTPRTYRGELPPRALDWRLVQRLLRSIDRSSATG